MSYDLHTGQILGLGGKILALLASLISASLPITGTLLWGAQAEKQEGPEELPGCGGAVKPDRPQRNTASGNGQLLSELLFWVYW